MNNQQQSTPTLNDHSAPKANVATILLVDDEEMITRLHERQFTRWGYKTIACNSIPDALKVIDDGRQIDLVITDYAMPRMTGTALAEYIHQKRPALPIIISTGNDLPLQNVDLPSLGIVGLIHKPTSSAVLRELVCRALTATKP